MLSIQTVSGSTSAAFPLSAIYSQPRLIDFGGNTRGSKREHRVRTNKIRNAAEKIGRPDLRVVKPGRINAVKCMKPAIILIETAAETFSFDVSDEALEIAAQTKEKSNFTLGACTGLSVCQG
jgi:hypothetical protein